MAKYGLRFDLVERPGQLRQLAAFLQGNVGEYDGQRHARWVADVCIPEVETGRRSALAWWEHGHMVGDAVLKVAASDTAELKNFRISQAVEGRALGMVMMRHVYLEAQDLLVQQGAMSSDANAFVIQLDTSPALVPYFAGHGFAEVGRGELYTPGKTEVIMAQEIQLH